MAKRIVCVTVALMLCVCLQRAIAMGEGITVTKETQGRLGLNYALIADRVDDKAVLVRMEIPRKGKLKDLRSVTMNIGEGRPIVSATLQTTPGKNGSWVVSFQLSPELADKCSIELILPSSEPLTYMFYAVELKGYVKHHE